MDSNQITDALWVRADCERRRDDPAESRHVRRQERGFVIAQNEVTASARSISADGMVRAVNFNHRARTVVAPTLLAGVARRNPAVAKHAGPFEPAGRLRAEDVMEVSARPPEAGRRLKPRPPARQHRQGWL